MHCWTLKMKVMQSRRSENKPEIMIFVFNSDKWDTHCAIPFFYGSSPKP